MATKVMKNRPRYKTETISKDAYVELLKTQDGNPSLQQSKVVCPMCKTSQSAEDLVEAGVDKDEVFDYWGFSCIGRFDKDQGCNWTLGGLFRIHELEVEDENGEKFVRFAPENWEGQLAEK